MNNAERTSTSKYGKQNKIGRMEAAKDMADARENESIPQLVWKIRAAAADDTGFGVGYLFGVALEVAYA